LVSIKAAAESTSFIIFYGTNGDAESSKKNGRMLSYTEPKRPIKFKNSKPSVAFINIFAFRTLNKMKAYVGRYVCSYIRL
jgi:hypothetical protein